MLIENAIKHTKKLPYLLVGSAPAGSDSRILFLNDSLKF